MSYILDALRKSEAERRQGKAPDLGHQVQMVYRPKKKPVPVVVWLVVIALLVNAGLMAYLFWPTSEANETVTADSSPALNASPIAEPGRATETQTETESLTVNDRAPASAEPDWPAESPMAVQALESTEPEQLSEDSYEPPVVIVPRSQPVNSRDLTAPAPAGRVPHLVELPLSFQKSVPDLTFNSHIHSSDPSASRVMINNQYLRAGDRFSQLTVEQITEDGVVLSKDGQRFRVGTVRDWVSPR
jgi:general secretion pathway protein B